jgi:hypothetical protein
VICFVDPRLNNGLTELGRRFAFSAMHHSLALADFFLSFPRVKASLDRYVRVFTFDPSEIVSEDEINNGIDKTYKIWIEVLAERQEEARRHTSTGTDGFRF